MTAGITSDLLEKISHIDLENDYYSQGFQSKVYKVDVDTPSGLKHFLILKKRLGDKESGNSIIQEYDFHSRSKDLLRKRPDLAKHIDVPTVWSILNDTQGNYFLIMDYIEGKTIFAHNVGATIPIVYKELQVKL